MKCECKIEINGKDDPNDFADIEQCPMCKAAPEMLEALEFGMDNWENMGLKNGLKWHKKIREAIKNAKP